jgi:hypothetical protein
MLTHYEIQGHSMQNLQRPSGKISSALMRAGLILLVPVVGLLILPVLLLFVVVFYLLALFQGTRVFVFGFRAASSEFEPEEHRPHFLDIQAKPAALSDESSLPPKG